MTAATTLAILDTQAQFEHEARRAKVEQILRAQAADAERMSKLEGLDRDRRTRAGEALGLLAQLRSTSDTAAFAAEMERWCRRPGWAFVGPNGQMFLKQLVTAGLDGQLLADVLTVPGDVDDAAIKIERLVAFVDEVKKGGHPAPARIPFLLSVFWAMQDEERWPVWWPSARDSLRNFGWWTTTGDVADNYLSYAQLMLELGSPPALSHAFFWFQEHRFVGLSPHLRERCERGRQLSQLIGANGQYVSAEVQEASRRNSAALTFELWNAVRGLKSDLAAALGHAILVDYSKLDTKTHLYRWWGWASGRVSSGPSLRLHVTDQGLWVAVSPGHGRQGWFEETGKLAAAHLPDGYELFQLLALDADPGRVIGTGQVFAGGEFLVGQEVPAEVAADTDELRRLILRAAADLAPLVDRFSALLVDGPTDDAAPSKPALTSDDLAGLVAEFRSERGYPLPKDELGKAKLADWTPALAPEELDIADPAVIRQIINSSSYGSPGPQSHLNATLNSADGPQLEEFFALIADLLWGRGQLAERLDRAFERAKDIPGLGESVLLKITALAHSREVLPVFPLKGDMGKLRLMRLIGLAPPSSSSSRGAQHVEANDSLRNSLEPHFPGDTWAQGQFLYWLRTRPEGSAETLDEADAVDALAEELHVPADYLATLRTLLVEKRQVIFFGPPGTGKTYLARKLAQLVAGDPARVRLVQFHPSTSYEDFFEGYRPEISTNGQLGYRLVPGPLARMAEEAAQAPHVQHVLVIDEINRANLPKVLGELLFLLEYRDEQAYTLYRPEEPFSLPTNLLVIGTMNTADRSIALIDAALRRRFQFVPFFPHEEPHSEVLRSWLGQRNPAAVWVADLVDHVNKRLVDLLGGPHLQIGPSHFFDEQLDMDRLNLVWQYSVQPFIEDQLWGRPDDILAFELHRAIANAVKDGAAAPPGWLTPPAAHPDGVSGTAGTAAAAP